MSNDEALGLRWAAPATGTASALGGHESLVYHGTLCHVRPALNIPMTSMIDRPGRAGSDRLVRATADPWFSPMLRCRRTAREQSNASACAAAAPALHQSRQSPWKPFVYHPRTLHLPSSSSSSFISRLAYRIILTLIMLLPPPITSSLHTVLVSLP
jgi:hypothetical protein